MAEAVAERSGGEFVPLGSASYKRLAVVRGEVDAYLYAGGRYECDSAAPLGAALAAGPHALRIDGSPLAYNQPDPTGDRRRANPREARRDGHCPA